MKNWRDGVRVAVGLFGWWIGAGVVLDSFFWFPTKGEDEWNQWNWLCFELVWGEDE